jgi:hypothetical protein
MGSSLKPSLLADCLVLLLTEASVSGVSLEIAFFLGAVAAETDISRKVIFCFPSSNKSLLIVDFSLAASASTTGAGGS